MLSENRVARYSTRHSRSGWLDRMVFQMHWDLDFTGVSFTEFPDMGFPWLLLAFNTKLECTQLSFHLCIFTRRGFAVYLCHTAPISFIYASYSPLNLGQLYIQSDDFTCLHVPGELFSDRFQQYIHTRNRNKKHYFSHDIYIKLCDLRVSVITCTFRRIYLFCFLCPLNSSI